MKVRVHFDFWFRLVFLVSFGFSSSVWLRLVFRFGSSISLLIVVGSGFFIFGQFEAFLLVSVCFSV